MAIDKWSTKDIGIWLRLLKKELRKLQFEDKEVDEILEECQKLKEVSLKEIQIKTDKVLTEKGIRINFEKLINDVDILKRRFFNQIFIENYIENVERFHFEQPFFFDKTNMFWFWNKEKKKYEIVDDIDVMSSLDSQFKFMGQTVITRIKTQYVEAMKRVGRQRIPEAAPTKWIQFKDKAFSLTAKTTYEVDSSYLFTNPIPWEIGDTDKTPMMDKLITEWVGKKYLKTAYEIIAYCCLSDYPIHLIFCLIGCGRNGKSKFLGLINKFIGTENICSTELDQLLDSRFESCKLYKKLVCTMGETNFGVISKTSLLKKLTGQDLIGYEYKNKLPFDDYNYAKIIISSNSLPPSEDTSEGFYRRWLILDFPNSFPEGKDILKTIPDEEYNNLANKVTKILPKLLEAGKFTNQGSIKERKERYIDASNPLSKYVDLFYDRDFAQYIRYSELYIGYRRFLIANKKRAISYKEFNEVLANEGLEVERTSKRIDGEMVSGRFILGLRLKYKDNFEDFLHKMSDMSDMSLISLRALYKELSEKHDISDISDIKQIIQTEVVK